MATRKELLDELNQQLEKLSDTVGDRSRALEDSNNDLGDAHDALRGEIGHFSNSLDESLEKHANAQEKAAQTLSKGLSDLGSDIIGAAVVGGALFLGGKLLTMLIERVQETNRKTEMIKSIQFLQSSMSPLPYSLAIERSSAANATTDQRQSILNELIHDGIVTVKREADVETLRIEPDNQKLLEYWDWIESIRREVQKVQDER